MAVVVKTGQFNGSCFLAQLLYAFTAQLTRFSKDIMVQNIDSILQRGERLDLLVDKTDTLAGQAYAFRRGARAVRRQQWWKNTRITILTGFVCFVGAGLLDNG